MSIPAVVIDEDYANASRRQERSHPENMIHRDAVKSHTENENSDRLRKLKSPASNRSLKRDNDDLPPGRRRTCAPTNTRNARTSEDDTEQDPTAKAGKLWRPDEEPLKRTDDTESSQPTRSSRTFEPRSPEMDQTEVPIKQPETRPITQEQLVAEVKGIYAGLVMVESKCIEVDNAQSSTIETGPKLNNEQWQALIALHRTLLHEHNDFFLSQSSSAPKKSHFSSGVTDYIVEGSVNGIGIEASPDTGSDECIVSSDFASKLGQSTIPGTEKTMTLANGKKVWSPGMIEVLWRFANDQTPHILKCWILPNSSKDFVLGSRFLKMTGALTKFFRHAKKAIIPSRPQLRLMGEKKERMMGFLNRRLTTALADTGSDLMAVSLKYAQLHKWAISTEREHRTEVELADGTRAWTCGTVSDATWTIGDRTVRCDFHVLDGLPADVILSKEYLFEMDVFTEHQDSFFDVEAIEDISLLCGIRLIEKEAFDLNELERDFPRTFTSTLPDAFNAQAVKRERRRRTLAEKMIEGLPDSERSEATKVEKGKRCRWDMARLGHNDLSKGQQPSLTSTAGQGGSSQSSRPALETIHQIQSSGQDSFKLGPI